MTRQFTQKYALIQLLEPMAAGTEFSSDHWPLHVTISDTFAVNWDAATMITGLTEMLHRHEPALSIAMKDAFFGPAQQTQVVLLEKTASLEKLHYDVAVLLERGGALFNDPQFSGAGFLPHATVQPHTRLQEGDAVAFRALSLIDMFPSGDPYRRQVLATMALAPSKESD